MKVFFAVLLVFACLSSAWGQEPELRMELDRNESVPGQPIILRLTVLVPTWMLKPPVLPGFEVPNLMVRLADRSTTPISERIDGETWSGITRAYRLYPMTEGSLSIPSQVIQVVYADPQDSQPLTVRLETDAIELRGTIPEQARDFQPFIAAQSLSLEQAIEGEIDGIAPGDVFSRTAIARIDGALPLVVPQLVMPLDEGGLKSYAAEPVVDETFDRGELAGTRTEKITYIARAGGQFQLPPVELGWFNLGSGEIETAELPGIDVVVNAPVTGVPAGLQGVSNYRWLVVASIVVLFLFLSWRLWPEFAGWLSSRRLRYHQSEGFAYKAVLNHLRNRDLRQFWPQFERWQLRREAPGLSDELATSLAELGAAGYCRTPLSSGKPLFKKAESALRRERRSRTASEQRQILPELNPTGEYISD